MTLKTACIMQPTYLPWIGYFDMMDQSDIFIFLDSVQFDKRSWQQRNRVKTADGELFLTIPVFSKGKADQKINEVLIDTSSNFHEKHIKTMEWNYKNTPFFDKYFPAFCEILNKKHSKLMDLNLDLIEWFKKNLGIKTECVLSSKLEASGKRVELLISLCQCVDAKRYLSPLGSKEYIDENNLFAAHGIDLTYHQYAHPVYPQLYGAFMPYLSIVDLLMNEGEGSLQRIRSGRVSLPSGAVKNDKFDC